MYKQCFNWILVSTIFVVSCQTPESTPQRIPMPLTEYGFERNSYDKESFEFLMGNGEMGGLVSQTGLGLEKLWFADLWRNSTNRQFLPGIMLVNDLIKHGTATSYQSILDISTATCSTRASFGKELTYSSTLFFSFKNDELLGIEVMNESNNPIAFEVVLPIEHFTIVKANSTLISGKIADLHAYNKVAWSLRSSQPLIMESGLIKVIVPVSEKLELFYSVVTEHDDNDFLLLAEKNVLLQMDFADAYSEHKSAWSNILTSIGSIIIPDSDYARWFYRSIYTNYATAGSKRFLAAETQFAYAEEDWDMHPFTYGHGSWAALSFLQFGDSARAKRSLQWLYQPESLRKNVPILIPDTGKLNLTYRGKKISEETYLNSYPNDAMAFAHEQTDFGLNIPYPNDAHWDLQFHLNGFATSLFHRYCRYYLDEKFEKEVTYPVIKGTAEFWKGLSKKDTIPRSYYLPPMLSLSENIVQPSVLDAVLAARWNLSIADEYEWKFGDGTHSVYATLAEQLSIPQNDSIYLEFKGDTQQRGGGGYFGIRASAYLGFPILENLKHVDRKKARRTLDQTWARNNYGKGMISFIANWFALTECYMGEGNKALEKSSLLLSYRDKNDTQLYEAFSYDGDSVRNKFNPYFLTGYSSLTLVPIAMMLQSYDNMIYFFPAMPSHWKNVEFYDLPVEGRLKVSGIYKDGANYEVWIKKDNEVIKYLKNTPEISIHDL